ncbi:hypothetical protein [Kitasatospora terrestris]|uniref:Uncharacterized protein n=1 Tax=Kitasatospora terrestris TaxID=258051 RepID=A0ABP9E1V8_9ACTN
MNTSSTEELIGTYTTASGGLVEVVQVTVTRTTDLDDAAAGSGPVWRCHACGDHSGAPYSNPFLDNPTGLIQAGAAAHASTCTA